MNIKVCGITQLKQLQQLEALHIGFAGFIFYEKSPRYVVGKLSSKEIKDIVRIKKVGVFVNAKQDHILNMIGEYSLDLIQLHGDESPELCKQLSEHTKVVKVFRLRGADLNVEELITPYSEMCDYFLFDTSPTDNSFGGTGQKFNWDVIRKAKISKPFFLSGGICIDDVPALRSFPNPDLYAVDINSRFETAPGIKDIQLINEFNELLNN